jgi:hypothetical protein
MAHHADMNKLATRAMAPGDEIKQRNGIGWSAQDKVPRQHFVMIKPPCGKRLI